MTGDVIPAYDTDAGSLRDCTNQSTCKQHVCIGMNVKRNGTQIVPNAFCAQRRLHPRERLFLGSIDDNLELGRTRS